MPAEIIEAKTATPNKTEPPVATVEKVAADKPATEEKKPEARSTVVESAAPAVEPKKPSDKPATHNEEQPRHRRYSHNQTTDDHTM